MAGLDPPAVDQDLIELLDEICVAADAVSSAVAI
jgi:hypothetical protein